MARCRTCAAVVAAMRADPQHWRGYYRDDSSLELDLQYSLSDRIRYYWPHPDVQRACAALLAALRPPPPPLTLLSQYLPRQYDAVRAGRLALARERVAARRHRARRCDPTCGLRPGAPGRSLTPGRLPRADGRRARIARRGLDGARDRAAARRVVAGRTARRRRRARLDGFLAPLLADPALRIVLTGAGTSAFIGDCLAPALSRAPASPRRRDRDHRSREGPAPAAARRLADTSRLVRALR